MQSNKIMKWMILLVICTRSTFANQLTHNSATIADCSINNSDVPFFSLEISENTEVGTTISTLDAVNVENVSIRSAKCESCFNPNEFIKLENKNGKLSFILVKELKKFREEMWDPVMEFGFILHCSTNSYSGEAQNKTKALVIVIKDENLNGPEIAYSSYTINVPEEILEDSGKPLNALVPITITDLDYNIKFASISVMCAETDEGNDCNYVNFTLTEIGKGSKGHNYELKIYLEIDHEFDKRLNFKVIAIDMDDSSKNTSATMTLIRGIPEVAEQSDFPLLPVASGGAAALLVICGAFGFMAYKKNKIETTLRKLTEVEIREFEHGSANISASGKRSVTMEVNAPIMSLPYQRQFDIPRENLRIDETSILGTGAFGIVMKGSVHLGGESVTVAVKTVKRNVGVLYFKALLSELKIMAYIGRNNNVVSLIGACTHNIRKRELYIAVEYCANGNFHNYLKCRKESFSNYVVEGKLHYGQNPYGRKNSFSKTVSTFDLIRWAYQIASGMEFLRSKSVIHGDMAARNVLLDENRIAKIADFGLSRRIVDYHSNYYHTKTSSNTPLPWKWMAPESLKYMTFSHKSDIWSFGIVLWETFTLAQTPYPGLSWSETFVERLENGLRMTKPGYAPDSIYEMMQDCWNTDPDDRPVIDDLKRLLEKTMNELLQQQGNGYLRVLGEKQILSFPRESIDGYVPQYTYVAPTDC